MPVVGRVYVWEALGKVVSAETEFWSISLNLVLLTADPDVRQFHFVQSSSLLHAQSGAG